MPEVKRTIGERDREARIREDLIGLDVDVTVRVVLRRGIMMERAWVIRLDTGDSDRTIAACACRRDATAIADALGLVLGCPVDTEAIGE